MNFYVQDGSARNRGYYWSVRGPFGPVTQVSWFPKEAHPSMISGATKEQAHEVAADIARRLNDPWGTRTVAT